MWPRIKIKVNNKINTKWSCKMLTATGNNVYKKVEDEVHQHGNTKDSRKKKIMFNHFCFHAVSVLNTWILSEIQSYMKMVIKKKDPKLLILFARWSQLWVTIYWWLIFNESTRIIIQIMNKKHLWIQPFK